MYIKWEKMNQGAICACIEGFPMEEAFFVKYSTTTAMHAMVCKVQLLETWLYVVGQP